MLLVSQIHFFSIFAGEPHPGKKACFNSIMNDWMLNGDDLTKVGVKEDECPCLKLLRSSRT